MTRSVVIRAARAADYAVLAERASDVLLGAAQESPQGQSVTFWHGEVPVALFGATVRWPGVADLWGVVDTEAAARTRFGLVRACRVMVEAYARERRLRRLAAWVHGQQPHCLRFARVMGFELEYTDHGAAPDGGDLLTVVRRW